MKNRLIHCTAILALCACHGQTIAVASSARASQESGATVSADASTVVRRLSSRNPLQRREAAEELARLATTEHRRLLEGYRVQEKDTRVKLAMDWALYRLGKSETLFALVRALDSKQSEQALGYLGQLETPEPLYIFLKRVNGNTQIRLLEVLARNGDAATLEQIKPFTASLDPGIADAAKFAEREIGIRIGEAPTIEPKRRRRVGNDEGETP
ncbi:MAG TPA: hypothetical protein VM934_16925 [Pyrinomonadaceae bacterium]|jgi:hypothetical protein|nr:hypothetical protein [Pyrinomonadaceae bacterium]